VFWYQSCIMFKYSRIESRTAVWTRGNAEDQYSCTRLNTTVRGHNTGLNWLYFHIGVWLLKVSWNGCADIYPTLFPHTNIEMWNVSETNLSKYSWGNMREIIFNLVKVYLNLYFCVNSRTNEINYFHCMWNKKWVNI
jgi:hypothetical protein